MGTYVRDSVRPQEEVDDVLALVAAGRSDAEIARRTGIPRRTVLDWRHGRASLQRRGQRSCGVEHQPGDVVPCAYAYLLGMYLGDGCLSVTRGIWRLRVVLDARYPAIVAECASAMEDVVPGKRAHLMDRRDGNCVQVSMWWMHWPLPLPPAWTRPQASPRIRLEAWQQTILSGNHQPFLRGLIHSDGCRFIARQRRGGRAWAWPRYVFSNRSEDIKDLFCASCDAIGVRWTRTARDVAVARRESVALLDEFIGPKRWRRPRVADWSSTSANRRTRPAADCMVRRHGRG
jgi:Homeodomain-like domain